MNWYNPVVNHLYFKNSILDLHSFKVFVKKSKREIRVRDFGKRKNDKVAGDKLNHDSHRLIIIHQVKREKLCCFSDNDLSRGR